MRFREILFVLLSVSTEGRSSQEAALSLVITYLKTQIFYISLYSVSRLEDTAQSAVSVGNVRGGYKKSKELWIR